MADQPRYHEPYLSPSRETLFRLHGGDGAAAERLLSNSLDDAEQLLVDAHSAGGTPGAASPGPDR
jgi:hypothetical protein